MANSSEREEYHNRAANAPTTVRYWQMDWWVAYGPLDLWAEYISKTVEYPMFLPGSAVYSANGIW
jgi:hypothetical protein